ncbi:LacI family transcriptional regulator [Litoreibacter halocynthiae]|uniref:LacI family transcriptional regulator n=1 Tax=Litoreibacter halocynthiae TaxID=1242689 RepID=A0A4R7LH98_9RHOB|nr:LacI family transcriptional regulator [Litoreibacter halocynthiae]
MKNPTKVHNKGFVSALKVAELAGVSRSAVSRTFSDGGSVSPETRQKVIAAAKELGYHVNHLARGLLSDRTNIVSLVIRSVSNPYQSRMMDEIIRVLQASDRVALVINADGVDDGAAQALTQSLNFRAEATVVLSGQPSYDLVDTCLANGQHVILLNRGKRHDGADRISIDNEGAATEAVRLNKRAGCRRHVVVSSTSLTPSLAARELAYVTEAKAIGDEVEVVAVGPTSYATGAEAARRVFGRASTPDAAFCVTDILALGFMDTARQEFQLNIPDDLCVIGFDDIEQAQWTSYRLTTFRQPVTEIAEQIGRLLGDPPVGGVGRDIALKTTPIWRNTVRPR